MTSTSFQMVLLLSSLIALPSTGGSQQMLVAKLEVTITPLTSRAKLQTLQVQVIACFSKKVNLKSHVKCKDPRNLTAAFNKDHPTAQLHRNTLFAKMNNSLFLYFFTSFWRGMGHEWGTFKTGRLQLFPGITPHRNCYITVKLKPVELELYASLVCTPPYEPNYEKTAVNTTARCPSNVTCWRFNCRPTPSPTSRPTGSLKDKLSHRPSMPYVGIAAIVGTSVLFLLLLVWKICQRRRRPERGQQEDRMDYAVYRYCSSEDYELPYAEPSDSLDFGNSGTFVLSLLKQEPDEKGPALPPRPQPKEEPKTDAGLEAHLKDLIDRLE